MELIYKGSGEHLQIVKDTPLKPGERITIRDSLAKKLLKMGRFEKAKPMKTKLKLVEPPVEKPKKDIIPGGDK